MNERPQLQTRPAQARDAEAVARIYHQATQDGLAPFEDFLVTPEERRRWIAERSEKHPAIVAELDQRILGWAALSMHFTRPRIEGVVEMLIYIDRDYRRHGVGRELMRALLDAARVAGHHKILGRFVAHNDAGRRLCRLAGFREVGVLEKHTRIDGRWLDVILVEYLIRENLR
jgi:phosphinothricin acetyltransferase